MQKASTKVDRSAMGVPGIDGFVFTVEVRPRQGRDGGTESITDGREREFKTMAALAKFAPFSADVSASIDDAAGASYFVVPHGTTQVNVEAPLGVLKMFPNKVGEVARVTQNVVATGWNDALLQFTRNLAPFLDHVSYAADVPVLIENSTATIRLTAFT